jgi:hypothetical protein
MFSLDTSQDTPDQTCTEYPHSFCFSECLAMSNQTSQRDYQCLAPTICSSRTSLNSNPCTHLRVRPASFYAPCGHLRSSSRNWCKLMYRGGCTFYSCAASAHSLARIKHTSSAGGQQRTDLRFLSDASTHKRIRGKLFYLYHVRFALPLPAFGSHITWRLTTPHADNLTAAEGHKGPSHSAVEHYRLHKSAPA